MRVEWCRTSNSPGVEYSQTRTCPEAILRTLTLPSEAVAEFTYSPKKDNHWRSVADTTTCQTPTWGGAIQSLTACKSHWATTGSNKILSYCSSLPSVCFAIGFSIGFLGSIWSRMAAL